MNIGRLLGSHLEIYIQSYIIYGKSRSIILLLHSYVFFLLIFMLRYFIQEHTEPIYMSVLEVRKKNGRPKIRAIEYRRIDVDILLWIWLVIYRLRAKNIKIRIQNILFCCCFRREMDRHGKKKNTTPYILLYTSVIKLNLTR
jgi:hypothetical protein